MTFANRSNMTGRYPRRIARIADIGPAIRAAPALAPVFFTLMRGAS
jgi:hypothetical protein